MDDSFKILSEHQMRFMQHKAQEMVLQLKEDVKWSQYCQNKKSHEINERPETFRIHPVENYTKDSAVQVSLTKIPSTPQHSFRSVKSYLPSSQNLSLRRNRDHSDIYSEDLKFIKQKLENLQMNISELKRKRNISDKDSSEPITLPHSYLLGRKESSETKLEVLREFLKNDLISLENEHRNRLGRLGNYGLNQSKHIGFQMPYALKEKLALESRKFNRQKQKTWAASIRDKKGKIASGQVQQHAKNSETRMQTDKGQPDVFMGASVKAQNEEKYIFASLEKKLLKIEEKEENLYKKWQTLSSQKREIKDFCYSSQKIIPHHKEEGNERNVTRMNPKNYSPSNLQRIPESVNENQDNMRNRTLSPKETDRTKLYLEPGIIKNIFNCKNSFSHSIKQTLHIQNKKFHPSYLLNIISDHILEECCQDVSEELDVISSTLIINLYRQEFQQS